MTVLCFNVSISMLHFHPVQLHIVIDPCGWMKNMSVLEPNVVGLKINSNALGALLMNACMKYNLVSAKRWFIPR